MKIIEETSSHFCMILFNIIIKQAQLSEVKTIIFHQLEMFYLKFLVNFFDIHIKFKFVLSQYFFHILNEIIWDNLIF